MLHACSFQLCPKISRLLGPRGGAYPSSVVKAKLPIQQPTIQWTLCWKQCSILRMYPTLCNHGSYFVFGTGNSMKNYIVRSKRAEATPIPHQDGTKMNWTFSKGTLYHCQKRCRKAACLEIAEMSGQRTQQEYEIVGKGKESEHQKRWSMPWERILSSFNFLLASKEELKMNNSTDKF